MVELPDESIQCVVTSPPYWGLRKYSGEQELIWGDKDCEHVWGNEIIRYLDKRNPADAEGRTGLNTSKDLSKSHPFIANSGLASQGNFCQLCQAWRGSYGLEPTPEMYIEHTIEILREIRRVLRKDGVVWWNIGDSYFAKPKSNYNGKSLGLQSKNYGTGETELGYRQSGEKFKSLMQQGYKNKDLCLIPFRVAIAAQEDGWWVRSIIIWHKKNPMPESVNGWRWEQHRIKVKSRDDRKQKANVDAKEQMGNSWPDNSGGVFLQMAEWQDCPGCPKCSPNDGLVLRKGSWRPTDSYEQILMLTKTANYYCDAEAVREAQTEGTFLRYGKNPKISPKRKWSEETDKGGSSNTEMQEHIESSQGMMSAILPNGRNLRNVWSFPTTPFPSQFVNDKKLDHFAVFPEKLPELCIKAATPEVGVCAKCGAPWARIVDSKKIPRDELPKTDPRYRPNRYIKNKYADELREGFECGMYKESQTLGWRPTCSCNCPETVPAVILDPFAGAGTTLLVAIKLGRSARGYELSVGYCDMINKRIDKVQIRYS